MFTPIRTPADKLPSNTIRTPTNKTTTVRILLSSVPNSLINALLAKLRSFARRKLPSAVFHSVITSRSRPSLLMSIKPSPTEVSTCCRSLDLAE